MPKLKKQSSTQRSANILESQKKRRLNDETRGAERLADVEARRKAREDEAIKEKEREARRIAREDEAVMEKEREARRIAREDDAVKEKERKARRIAREDEAVKDKEREARRLAREDEAVKENEREARQTAREQPKRLETERRRDAEAHRNRRANGDSIICEFKKAVKMGPNIPCCSCDGLFFQSSMKAIQPAVLVTKYGDHFYKTVLRPIEKPQVCCTCHLHITKGNVPKLCFSNGFEFPPIPEQLRPRTGKNPKGLTQLEERLVAARIPFMCIVKLGVDRQCGLKGNVINVVNPINETAKILPRRFQDAAVIPLMLMRKITYNHAYIAETIRPKAVFEAARYLAQTELYKEEEIVLSEDWIREMDEDVMDFDLEDMGKSKNHPLKQAEEQVEEDLNPGGQQTLLMDFDALENNEAVRFAPGEGQKPISLLMDLNAEALSFPTIYCGVKRQMKNPKITRTDIAKSDARHKDRRCAIPSKLLYSYKLVQTHQVYSQIQLCLRKKKGKGKPTAGNLINDEFVDNLVQHDDAYKVLKNIRSSPAYWEDRQKVLMAMIRQLGIPTLFITLSAAEVKWPELIVILKKVLDEEEVSEEDAAAMPWDEKADLIRRDPITCSRYFDYRMRQCNKYILLHRTGIFKDHPIIDFFTRIEFQHRGSPHMHGLFWLKDTPKFNEGNPESLEDCESFIDKYVSCTSDADGSIHQKHKHKRCCEVIFKGNKKCRFGIPYPPMSRTRILLPFPTDLPEYLKKSASNHLQAIKNQIEYLMQEKVDLSYEEFLDYMGLEEPEYIMAVRSSINRPTVFLKRRVQDALINAFNPPLAELWKANMDIQFILDPYACCKYCAAYVSKSCRGMSELLNQVVQEVKDGNLSCKERLKRFSHVFLNGSEVSAQEAAYSVLSLPLSRCSRDSIYINTSLPAERVHLTKSTAELKELPVDSTDVNVEGLMEHYCNRPAELEQCSLAEFAAYWTFSKKRTGKTVIQQDNSDNDDNDEGEDTDEAELRCYALRNSGYIRKRGKARIIRFRNFGFMQDPENYYRENIMLYVPWRDEEVDILSQDAKGMYEDRILSIERVKSEFDQRLDMASMQEEINQMNMEEDQEEFNVDDEFQILHDPDLEGDFGLELCDAIDEKAKKIKMPNMIDDKAYQSLISSLNEKQLKYHEHVLGNIANRFTFNEFVAGGAGYGKSMLITSITQTIMRNSAKVVGKDPERLTVLLSASTGVAAFNIGGVTLHQAFGLPFTQFNGPMPRLKESTRNKFAHELRDLEVIIIDEISMTSMEQLFQVDDRLRQIFKSQEDFAGKPIIAVGDFNQLEPVMASWIFSEPKKGLGCLGGNHLWCKFRYYELTECMRQKEDKAFAEALHRLATGMCTDEDVVMFRSREIETHGLVPPESAIQLMYTNNDVDLYNSIKLSNITTEGIISYANDRVQGRGKLESHGAIRDAAKKLPTKKAQNLPLQVNFKIGAKYMMTVNADTSDGLVNGAIGVLQKITYGNTTEGRRVPLKVWMDFPKDVGKKLKKIQKKGEQMEINWVPVGKESRVIHRWPGRGLEVVRTQFAFVPAEAITIHKSQGSTFTFVVVSVSYSTKTGAVRKIPRRALYVGFSRCPSLSGLFIKGKFEATAPPGPNDPVELEMEKLRARPVIFKGEGSIAIPGKPFVHGAGIINSSCQPILNSFAELVNPIVSRIGTMHLYKSDIESILNPTGWLTDNAIDCFVNLVKIISDVRGWTKIFNFGTFMLDHLKRSDMWKDESWGMETGVNLMIFPRCHHGHWTVFVADSNTHVVSFYDSMNMFSNYDDSDVIVNFLHHVDRMEGRSVEVPWSSRKCFLESYRVQTNGYDCGIYVCKFVENLCRQLPFCFGQRNMLGFRAEISRSLLANYLQ